VSIYSVEMETPSHFVVIKDGERRYNITFKKAAWSCDCPARKACKHLLLLPEEVQVKRYTRSQIEYAYDQIAPVLFPYRHSICGSYRRGAPDSKDVDLIVLMPEYEFIQLPAILEPYGFKTIQHGNHKLSGTINGIPFDIDRVQDPNTYAAHMLYRTGPADLNIRMRRMAQAAGFILNEKVIAKNEEEIFRMVNMDYIDPQLRK
jgi:DNA polymerase/3'-5' exonuclease PolX